LVTYLLNGSLSATSSHVQSRRLVSGEY
jgi:hypothetical protein